MWYFFAGVLGDVELALDSFGDDPIEQDDLSDEASENTESELHPPPGAFKILFNRKLQYSIIGKTENTTKYYNI